MADRPVWKDEELIEPGVPRPRPAVEAEPDTRTKQTPAEVVLRMLVLKHANLLEL